MQARGKQYRRFCEGNTNRNIKRVGVLPIYENEGLRFSLTKGLRLKHPTSLSVYRHYTNLLYFALYFNRLLTKHTTLICGGKTGATWYICGKERRKYFILWDIVPSAVRIRVRIRFSVWIHYIHKMNWWSTYQEREIIRWLHISFIAGSYRGWAVFGGLHGRRTNDHKFASKQLHYISMLFKDGMGNIYQTY